MALIRYAEGQQRSGSIGGSVYSRNRFGAYIRARSIPVNPNTDRQVAVRNAVRALAIGWQTILTQAERDAWAVYAANVTWKNRLSQDVKLTALNQYVRSNTPLLVGAFARIDAAPTIMDLAQAEQSLSAIASEATQLITVTVDVAAPWAIEDNGHEFIYTGLPQNSGVKFFGGPYRYAFVINGQVAVPPVGPFPFASPFPIAEGQRIWIRTRVARADARLSEFAQVNILVGP